MLAQTHIDAATPTGATLAPGGATFRVWAPRASAVYLNGSLGGVTYDKQTDDRLLAKNGTGYWTGFQAGAADGDTYRYWVVGAGGSGYKRDALRARVVAHGLPKLLQHPACYRRLPLARRRLPHPRLLGHGHLPVAYRDLRDLAAGDRVELPRCRGQSPVPGSLGHKRVAAAADRRARGQPRHGIRGRRPVLAGLSLRRGCGRSPSLSGDDQRHPR